MQRWIAACAVYPELNWNLTLTLGERIYGDEAGSEPLNSWRNVSRLLRLEWFIRGRIPDAFRLQLIGSWLTGTEVAEICRFLHEQLGSAPPLPGEPGYDGSALQLAVYDLLGERDETLKQEKRDRLHKMLDQESRLPDIVTLHYANTDDITPLDFPIPEQLLERLGVDIRELKREREKRALPENFVMIKGGTFMMGSPKDEKDRFDDELQHEVKVSEFAICRYAVTQKEWQLVTGSNPSKFKGDNLPVDSVSWDDCQDFIKRLNQKTGQIYRLPTEAEWEYACRAGTTTPFNTGENLTTKQANYDGNYPYGNNPKGKYRKIKVPVDHFEPNGWGLYNMHGNVWEWCSDWFDSKFYDERQKKGILTNPQGPETGSDRVLRGGSWSSIAHNCRSAYRYGDNPGYRNDNVGFRLVFVPQFTNRKKPEEKQ